MKKLYGCLCMLLSLCGPAHAVDLHVGLTTHQLPIQAQLVNAAHEDAPMVVVVGGLRGKDASVAVITKELRGYLHEASPHGFRLVAVPLANPEALAISFPPQGSAYRDAPEGHALWRWLAMTAPDLVLVVGEDAGLVAALQSNTVTGVGRIPVLAVAAQAGFLRKLPTQIATSDAQLKLRARLARSPRQLAESLSAFYGNAFNELNYIQATALSARLRLGHVDEVRRVVEPYLNALPVQANKAMGVAPSGLFVELAQRTGDQRFLAPALLIGRQLADGVGPLQEATLQRDDMPESIFMNLPFVAQLGNVTGQPNYVDLALRHYTFMSGLDLRDDGVFRHSPLTNAAWGRGNGFALLGLAQTLSRIPMSHPAYGKLLSAYQRHAKALRPLQDSEGMWRQLVDYPSTYPETSVTSMVGNALAIGLRKGWLPQQQYRPVVQHAWQAVNARVDDEGHVLNVCEGTGKQKTLDDYFKRIASDGIDPRGGAMVMLFATELAGLAPE